MSGVSETFKAEFGPQCLHRERNIFHFVKLWAWGASARGSSKAGQFREDICGKKKAVKRKLTENSELNAE